MEQDKILTHVYVVEVESKQQDKDNSNDVCDIYIQESFVSSRIKRMR